MNLIFKTIIQNFQSNNFYLELCNDDLVQFNYSTLIVTNRVVASTFSLWAKQKFAPLQKEFLICSLKNTQKNINLYDFSRELNLKKLDISMIYRVRKRNLHKTLKDSNAYIFEATLIPLVPF